MLKKILPIWVLLLIAVFSAGAYGESAPSEVSVEQPSPLSQDLASAPVPEPKVQAPVIPQETEKSKEGSENNVTLDFKDADIQN
ncbi:MAG: hypothetical protein Q8Q87_01865, partial [Candidatus Omnitrophota bacterium]|nr:hypothetical protein [Candidatus Omnitrophota bacterium]